MRHPRTRIGAFAALSVIVLLLASVFFLPPTPPPCCIPPVPPKPCDRWQDRVRRMAGEWNPAAHPANPDCGEPAPGAPKADIFLLRQPGHLEDLRKHPDFADWQAAFAAAELRRDPKARIAAFTALAERMTEPLLVWRGWIGAARTALRSKATDEAARYAGLALAAAETLPPGAAADAHYVLGVAARDPETRLRALLAAVRADPGYFDAHMALLRQISQMIARPEFADRAELMADWALDSLEYLARIEDRSLLAEARSAWTPNEARPGARMLLVAAYLEWLTGNLPEARRKLDRARASCEGGRQGDPFCARVDDMARALGKIGER
ncbi:MAG: hypothetical protein D6754_04310 [Alphaproteobacteria bacterium]|nr:MAG: hypothetical protein D6754_04310 [Alphaproteobacteria bacterium]